MIMNDWVDFVIFLGYKFYVICGVGFIYVCNGCKLVLLMNGGG